MKNDYRDYISHSLFGHKFIRKEKTASGNWRYIYPEDEVKKEKLNKVKRNISYALRNLKSKITGKNKTFTNNTSYKTVDGGRRMKDNINNYNYEKLQRDTRAKYQDKANRNMYSKQNAMKGDSRYKTSKNYYDNVYRNENTKSNNAVYKSKIDAIKRKNSGKIPVNWNAAAEFNAKLGKIKNVANVINSATKKKKKKKK